MPKYKTVLRDELFMFSPNALGISEDARECVERSKATNPAWYSQFKSSLREIILAPNKTLGEKAHEHLEASCSDHPDEETKISEAEQYFRDIWEIVAPGETFPLDEPIVANTDKQRSD